MATNWDMYDTYNSQENNQEGGFGLRLKRCDTLGARGFFFRSEAATVFARILIAASPLTIAASLTK